MPENHSSNLSFSPSHKKQAATRIAVAGFDICLLLGTITGRGGRLRCLAKMALRLCFRWLDF